MKYSCVEINLINNIDKCNSIPHKLSHLTDASSSIVPSLQPTISNKLRYIFLEYYKFKYTCIYIFIFPEYKYKKLINHTKEF